MPRPTEASGLGEKRNLVIHPGGTFYDFSAGNVRTWGHQAPSRPPQMRARRKLSGSPRPSSGTTWAPAASPAPSTPTRTRPDAEDDLRRTTEINEIWQAAQPIDGSPAETYLKSRGLDPDRQDRKALRQLKNRLTGSVSMLAAHHCDGRRLSPCRKPS